MITWVDPLTSILAVLAKSYQILTTSWRHGSQDCKNTIPSVQAAETKSKGSFHPKTTISTGFHNQNASTR